MKKVLSVLIAIIMCVALVPFTICAGTATSGECGANLTWSFDVASGILTIQGSGDMYDYTSIMSHSNAPFMTDDIVRELRCIDIKQGVTSIGDNAFLHEDLNLDIVNIPVSITELGIDNELYNHTIIVYGGSKTSATSLFSSEMLLHAAFYYNSQIVVKSGIIYIVSDDEAYVAVANKNITGKIFIHKTVQNKPVTKIFPNAFGNCTSMNEISIPDSVTEIGYSAFASCTSLSYLRLPKNLISLNSEAFSNCTNLKTVVFPQNYTTVNAFAFNCTDNIETVYYEGTESEKTNITFEEGNDGLKNATWNYEFECDTHVWDSTPTVNPEVSGNRTQSTHCSICYAEKDVTAYNPPGNNGNVITDQNMSLTHSIDPTYTVTIPATTSIDSSVTVSVSDIKISKGKNLTIEISATSGENNAYTLTSVEGASITYSVKKDGTDVVVGTPFLSVSADDVSGSATLDFDLVGEEKYAGKYTGTITFTISVE